MKSQKEYVLYGTGFEGEKFFYSNYEITKQIVYCIDSFHTGDFHGIPIVTLEQAENLESYYMYVAAIWPTYKVIKQVLEGKGLVEYKNFSWASECNKQIVVVNANCHGVPIVQYLEKSREFRRKYIIHPIPQIQDNKEIEISLLENTDVYIHQNIRSNNSVSYKLSDEYILPRLKKDCMTIIIPNFYDKTGEWMHPEDIGELLPSLKLKTGESINTFFENIVLESGYKNNFVRLSEYVEYYIIRIINLMKSS